MRSEEIWGLNDAYRPPPDEDVPLHTFAEIGDILAKDWGLE